VKQKAHVNAVSVLDSAMTLISDEMSPTRFCLSLQGYSVREKQTEKRDTRTTHARVVRVVLVANAVASG
jgi:hypothetical protein